MPDLRQSISKLKEELQINSSISSAKAALLVEIIEILVETAEYYENGANDPQNSFSDFNKQALWAKAYSGLEKVRAILNGLP